MVQSIPIVLWRSVHGSTCTLRCRTSAYSTIGLVQRTLGSHQILCIQIPIQDLLMPTSSARYQSSNVG